MAMSDHPKHAAPAHEILDVIRLRWSPRAFDTAEVASGELKRLFEAARWAPSSSNEQPWRFVVTDRRHTPEAFQALLETLTPSNQGWARAAPVLVLIAVSLTLSRSGALNRHAWYDAGGAVALLTLQATALGLGVRQMEGFDHDRAAEVCAVPPSFEAGV